MPSRRRLLLSCTAALALPGLAGAVQRQSLLDPLRVAVDDALVDSGFAPQLQRAFGRETGVAIALLPGPATAALEALERGERDVALCNAPGVEERLDKQGLVYNRRPVAVGQFVLIGPGQLARALGAGRDVALALSRLASVGAPFLSAGDGSGTHVAEQALWRAAQVAPAAPWYAAAERGRALVAEARARRACAVVERGVWRAQGGGGLSVLVEGDPRLAVDVHAMRSFRSKHGSTALFIDWITRSQGRRAVTSVAGYAAPRR